MTYCAEKSWVKINDVFIWRIYIHIILEIIKYFLILYSNLIYLYKQYSTNGWFKFSILKKL